MRAPLLIASILALLSPAAMAQSVGVASAVNQSATGVAPGQGAKTVYLGDQIIHNQKITTDANGLLQILLADGTSFTVGPSSTLTIDSFVYDPDKGTAKIVADLGTGLFRFIGGASSKSPDGVTLNTPVGTVGVRGGITNFDFSGHGPYHADLIYGQGLWWGTTPGKILSDIYKSGYSLVFDKGKVNIVKTPPEWNVNFQGQIAGHGSGSVSGSKVAGGLGNTNKSNQNNNGDQHPNTQVASSGPQGPVATWAQINNSDLAGVGARYDGLYDATLTYTGHGSPPPSVSTTVEDKDFALVYQFATREGTAYFANPIANGDPVPSSTNGSTVTIFHHQVFIPSTSSVLSVKIPVTSPAGSGAATFSGATSSFLGSSSVNGLFLNTNDGVAHGVAGTFDTQLNLLGTWDMNGVFSGNLSSTTP